MYKERLQVSSCSAFVCARSSKSSSFRWVLLIVRDSDVAVVRESETFFLLNGVQCFCRAESYCLVRILSPLYFLQNTCTFFLTSNQFELQWSLIRINESLPRSSELQARGIWIRSTELLVFRILWHLVFRIFKSSDAGDVHQNFCLQNLQALDQKQNLQKLGLFIRTSCLRVFRSF